MKTNRWWPLKRHFMSALSAAIGRLLMPLTRGRRVEANFSRSAIDGLRNGITTCEQAAERLGDPFGVSTDVEGKRLVTWCYADRASAIAVAIAFSKEGIMERVVAFCEIHPS